MGKAKKVHCCGPQIGEWSDFRTCLFKRGEGGGLKKEQNTKSIIRNLHNLISEDMWTITVKKR